MPSAAPRAATHSCDFLYCQATETVLRSRPFCQPFTKIYDRDANVRQRSEHVYKLILSQHYCLEILHFRRFNQVCDRIQHLCNYRVRD